MWCEPLGDADPLKTFPYEVCLRCLRIIRVKRRPTPYHRGIIEMGQAILEEPTYGLRKWI
jgi:hypothetical protein